MIENNKELEKLIKEREIIEKEIARLELIIYNRHIATKQAMNNSSRSSSRRQGHSSKRDPK